MGLVKLADWLKHHKLEDASNITLFTPAEVIAEDAGGKILDQINYSRW
jgi:sulfide:quinone oxidoreductase